MIVVLIQYVFFVTMVTAQEISNSVYKCPRMCTCEFDSEVICNRGNITEIPIHELPPSVTKLSISKINIPFVRQDTFNKLKELIELNLDDNNLSRIEQFAFRGLGKLQKLSIQKTSLSKLEKFSFSGLQNMTFVLLRNNRIRSIEESTFAGSSNIRLIVLHNNPIHVIQSKAFANLRNVEYLVFPSGIQAIRPDAFNSLDSVGLIKLPYMDLKNLESFTFRGLSHVQLLDISESDLGIVRPRAFDGMTYVNTLKLWKNKIDHLQELRIKSESKIRNLRLEGNHLLQIPTPGSVDIQVLENFVVADNHFPCDCRLHSLLASPLANDTSAGFRNFTTKNFCISPLEMNGKPISRVPLENVGRCSDEYSLDSQNMAASSRRKLIFFHKFYIILVIILKFC